MTANEFIGELEQALIGQVDRDVVDSNVSYYRSYIREQVSVGKSEEEVLMLLGSPRVIAKTIIIAEEARRDSRYEEQAAEETGEEPKEKGFHFSLENILYGKWYYKVLAAAAAVVLLYVLAAVIFTVVKILFWPVVLVIVGYTVYSLIRKYMH